MRINRLNKLEAVLENVEILTTKEQEKLKGGGVITEIQPD